MAVKVTLYAAFVAAVLSGGAVVAQEEEQCGLYVAASSTSTVDEPKWGLYAGTEIPAGSSVGYPEVAIQTFNMMSHVVGTDPEPLDEEDTPLATRVVEFLEEYIWVPQSSAGQFELDVGRSVTAIGGTGVLGGFNAKLTNSEWEHRSAFFRPAMGEQPGVGHPGRGAYTNFFNVKLAAKDAIAAGSEVFLDYGENWEDENADEDEAVLTKDDHKKLDETIDRVIAFFEKYEDQLDRAGKADIYDFITKDIMGAAAGAKKGRQIAALLPSSPEELYQVKEAGGSLAYSSPASQRTAEWLRDFGRCMDNIRPGPSTIPNAGRGAFATRRIKEGGLVSPVPLVHIPDKSIMDMYNLERRSDGDEGEEYLVRVDDEVVGSQLLLNYCYGHPQSSLLFFPSGSISTLINHSQEPNAKMVWSEHPNHHPHWYDVAPEQLLDMEYRYIGLMIEIIATRDIEEGEEVFIDYGPEWQAAWDTHVEEWNAKVASGEISSDWPLRALDMNEIHRAKPFKTQEELEDDPLPENLTLKCFLVVRNPETDEEAESRYGDSLRYWSYEGGKTYDSDNVFDCVILEREILEDVDSPTPYNYTAKWGEGENEVVVKDVPHNAIVFVDSPLTSDQFLTSSFRHSIGIPDDIFPQGPWRNLE